MGSISSYNIAGLISEVSEEVAILKSPKIALADNPTLIWGPHEYLHLPYISSN